MCGEIQAVLMELAFQKCLFNNCKAGLSLFYFFLRTVFCKLFFLA